MQIANDTRMLFLSCALATSGLCLLALWWMFQKQQRTLRETRQLLKCFREETMSRRSTMRFIFDELLDDSRIREQQYSIRPKPSVGRVTLVGDERGLVAARAAAGGACDAFRKEDSFHVHSLHP